jgi:hypothetical protein
MCGMQNDIQQRAEVAVVVNQAQLSKLVVAPRVANTVAQRGWAVRTSNAPFRTHVQAGVVAGEWGAARIIETPG